MFDKMEKQTVADHLKRLTNSIKSRSNDDITMRSTALEAIQDFERGTWNPAAFAEAFAQVDDLAMRGNGEIVFAGNATPHNIWSAVWEVLTEYKKLFLPLQPKPDLQFDEWKTIEESAEYIGVSLPSMKRYYHTLEMIPGHYSKNGGLYFYIRDLDWLKAHRPRRGHELQRLEKSYGDKG